jgi:GNAT superfamily N-acetyltransferase
MPTGTAIARSIAVTTTIPVAGTLAKQIKARWNEKDPPGPAIAAGSVQKQETPERIVQGIANHPLGVILLARLAVDKSEHGNGFGKALLRHALARIAQAADVAGVRCVLVHAIDDPARRFYLHLGVNVSV